MHFDRNINANRPKMYVNNFKDMIDMSIPDCRKITLKEFEKLSKYKDVKSEIGGIW